MFTHIIWDFDGTLFDTYPMLTNAFKVALEDMGVIEDSKKLMSQLKISELTAINYFSKEYGVDNVVLKSGYDKHKKEADLSSIKPFPDVVDVCREIFLSGRRNYLYTHRGYSSIETIKYYSMFDYFSDFITKENEFKRKPDPEALLFLINKHKIKPEEAIMVGDREIDLLAAKNAGIKACLFDYEEAIKSRYADFTINNMSQLLDII